MKTIDHMELAEQILDSSPNILEYSVAPPGANFRSHTEALRERGKYHKCYAYVIWVKDGKQFTTRAGHRNLLKIVAHLESEGVVDSKKARGIVEENRCHKCGGSGFIPGYEHIENGVCFKCGGSGTK